MLRPSVSALARREEWGLRGLDWIENGSQRFWSRVAHDRTLMAVQALVPLGFVTASGQLAGSRPGPETER